MTRISVQITGNVVPSEKTPRKIGTNFRRLLESGYRLRADGQAKSDPDRLLRIGYTPKYEIELFGTRFFLCNQRDAEGLKVMPAYVLPATKLRRGKPIIYARIFYKDSSLVWRSASHYRNTPEVGWIGKGAVRFQVKRGDRDWYSAEETTNLPYEVQADENGRFGIEGLPGGRYRIEALHPGLPGGSIDRIVELSRGATTTIELGG